MPSSQSSEFDWPAFADRLMAAGEQLAVKLCDTDSSPWTEQILDEWQEAKDVRPYLPDAPATNPEEQT